MMQSWCLDATDGHTEHGCMTSGFVMRSIGQEGVSCSSVVRRR